MLTMPEPVTAALTPAASPKRAAIPVGATSIIRKRATDTRLLAPKGQDQEQAHVDGANIFDGEIAQSKPDISLSADSRDFVRQWGVLLLKENDPAFADPAYLKMLQAASKPGTVSHYPSYHPFYTKQTKPLEDFNRYFSALSAGNATEVIRFTHSGTDANNALFEMAEHAYQTRTGKAAKRVNLLHFDNSYGGVYGRIAEFGGRYEGEPGMKENFQVPTPHLKSFVPKDDAELEQVKEIEDKAIEFIRKQVARSELEIGAIFIEPVSGFNGVRVYRPEFMKRLRETADELGVPIFADEVLTGGGRTGKFWASYQYPDFAPDLITFGKGLIASGVAAVARRHVVNGWLVNRWDWPHWKQYGDPANKRYPEVVLDNTSRIHPLVLLQAVQVLKRILKGGLVKNAERSGAYLLESLRNRAKVYGLNPDEINGVGLLLHVGELSQELTRVNISDYKGRWTPPLTISKEEITAILKTPDKTGAPPKN